ncbi:MAG: PBECR2 nuclease fold domain-containing protein [Lachnospirales bacterium]
MATQVGTITPKIIDILGITDIKPNTPIFLGETNIQHMKSSHPIDYKKYGNDITNILSFPDYVGINKKDNSIEYVKEFRINEEFVKVAVRISLNGNLFARSIYVLNKNRVNNFINKGTLKRV